MVSQLLLKDKLSNSVSLGKGFDSFFTCDRQLIEEYFKLRELCYRAVKDGPKDFCGDEDRYDPVSDILIVRHNDRVIGGARITGNISVDDGVLPMEQDGFSLPDMFPDLDLQHNAYCEFTRFAVLKEWRSNRLLEIMVGQLIQKAAQRRYAHLFSVSPIVQARCYKQVCHKLGLPHPFEILSNLKLPRKSAKEAGRLKMYLSSLKLPQENECRFAVGSFKGDQNLQAA